MPENSSHSAVNSVSSRNEDCHSEISVLFHETTSPCRSLSPPLPVYVQICLIEGLHL